MRLFGLLRLRKEFRGEFLSISVARLPLLCPSEDCVRDFLGDSLFLS